MTIIYPTEKRPPWKRVRETLWQTYLPTWKLKNKPPHDSVIPQKTCNLSINYAKIG